MAVVDTRSDAVLAGDFLAGVDIAFGKRDFAGRSVFLRERLEGGRDGFAGAAPGCVDCLWISFYFIFSFFHFLFPSGTLLRGWGLWWRDTEGEGGGGGERLTVDDDHGVLGERAGQLGGRAEDLDLRHGGVLLGTACGGYWVSAALLSWSAAD